MELKNVRLIISYDGTDYHGWQVQKDKPTIQGIIESKLSIITREKIRLTGSGRTDAGVHAIKQVANFKTQSDLNPEEIKNALNSMLPEDIYIKYADYVPMGFHARYMARSKTYKYRILNRKEPDIFQKRYHWHVLPPLNMEDMAEALSLIIGTHDFSSFKSSGSSIINPVRTIYRADLIPDSEGFLCIIIEANGFLRHMVRNVVGTIVQVGYGKIGLDRFRDILSLRDRRFAGKKAPAKGLFLLDVKY